MSCAPVSAPLVHSGKISAVGARDNTCDHVCKKIERLGDRHGVVAPWCAARIYARRAGVFALGTMCCALAQNIGSLIAARGVQGWAGGLVSGSGMALIASLFDQRLRTRIIAISQGTFTACLLRAACL
jgi:MFS family permease